MPVRSEIPKAKASTTPEGLASMGTFCAGKCHGEEHACTGVGDDEAGHSADDREDDTFGEELADDSCSHRAKCCSDGHLFAAVHPADE